jgi:hypothetical protein
MACFRNTACQNSVRLQRGRGLGNVLRSLYGKVTPTLKAVGSKVLDSPVTKAALSTVKDIATNAGLNVLKDTLKGEDVSKSVKSNLSVAKRKLSQDLLKQLYEQSQIGRGRKKRRRTNDSEPKVSKKTKLKFLFDDDSVVID